MSDKYFPAKPDDVTCRTCPYFAGYCRRSPDGHRTPEEGSARHFCGEHPWFVAQRDELRALQLASRIGEVLHNGLSDLARNLSR